MRQDEDAKLLAEQVNGLEGEPERYRIMRLEEDARRYRWLRYHVQGQRDELAPEGQDFVLQPPDVMPGQNIMKGSVAEHLDAAIDAAMSSLPPPASGEK